MGCRVPALISRIAVVEGGWFKADFNFNFFSSIIFHKKSEATHAVTPTVERDFRACGNLIVPSRSRTDTYWVEMGMLLKANVEHISDYGAIPMIAAKDIRACLPARFTGNNVEFVAAEDDFDALNNLAASATQDIWV